MLLSIASEQLDRFRASFSSDRRNLASRNAVTSAGVNQAAKNPEAARRTIHEFSISLPQGEVTNQKQSGRCWMFAATNLLRFHLIQSLNLENFELSQNYTLFYDKLEKSNYFLENILETLEEPANGRLVSWLLTDPIGDGGQWDMILNLIEKYGAVPKYAMPETAVSSSTREMNGYITEKLREFACRLRGGHAAGKSLAELRGEKEEMMGTVYRMLAICLGEPPKAFDFEVRDKDKKLIRDCGLTPLEFYHKYINMDLGEYVSLINAPTADKPFHKSYTVKYLGNVKEGRPVRYLNLPIKELKRSAIAQMRDGLPVWFGCDVSPYSSSREGIMDLSLYGVADLFGTPFAMDKAQRLDYGQSLMTHAMVFTGVELDDSGEPVRWRVENSWGDEGGKKGFYSMDDRWFDEYMYQVVVKKCYLTGAELSEYEAEPAALEPWDPMGSLA